MENVRINLNPIEDITDFPPNTVFDQVVKEVIEKYDAFLAECFEMCQISTDYIYAHPEEFFVRKEGYDGPSTYFWKGMELFTIRKIQQFNQNAYTIQYEAEYPKG